MNLKHLTKVAILAARSAGKVIQTHMNEDVAVEKKQGSKSPASQVVTEVDRTCERIIFSYLLPTCEVYDLALLSEETEDDGSRFEKAFFWCIDPMDGTLPFIQKRPGFSVSIALVAQDGTPHIGVVYDPCTDTLYEATKEYGAYKDSLPWNVNAINPHLSYVTDRKLKDTPGVEEIEKLLQEQVEKLGLAGTVEMDGAGSVLNAIRVLENGPACMLKLPKKELGGGSIWDFAATACIFQELGLPATNFTGGKLNLNRKGDTYMNEEGIFFATFPHTQEIKLG